MKNSRTSINKKNRHEKIGRRDRSSPFNTKQNKLNCEEGKKKEKES